MLKLLRRQAEWLIALGLLFMGTSLFLWNSVPREHIYQLPNGRFLTGLFFIIVAFGLVLGLFIGLHDSLTSTRDYLRHRPLQDWKFFALEHGTSLIFLSLCFVIPLVLRRCWETDADGLVFGYRERVFDDPGRWMLLFSLSTTAFATYAIGFFMTRALGNRFTRLMQGGVLFSAWVFLSYTFMESHWRLSVFGFASLQVLLTLYLLILAARNEIRAEDRDITLKPKTLAANLIVIGLAASLSMGVLATEFQSKLTSRLQTLLWPGIRVIDGEFLLVTPSSRDRKQRIVDEQHRSMGVDQEALVQSPEVLMSSLASLNSRVARRSPGWGSYSYQGLGPILDPCGIDYFSTWWLDRSEGVLRRFRREWISLNDGKDVSQESRVIHRDDGKPFSNQTRMAMVVDVKQQVELGFQILLVDDSDGSVWGLTTSTSLVGERDPRGVRGYVQTSVEPELIRLQVPDGDRVIKFDVSPRMMPGLTNERDYVVMGQRSAYQIVDGRMDRAEMDLLSFHYDLEVVDRDHLSPEIVVHDLEGKEVFRHRYGLYSSEEKWTGTKLIATSFLRAPLSLLVSAFAEELSVFGYKEDRVVLDPLVAGGHNLWLVLALLAFGILLALLQDWRLRRLGVAGAARLFWFLMILFGGLGIMILALLIERPRRHADLPSIEAKPLLLKSA